LESAGALFAKPRTKSGIVHGDPVIADLQEETMPTRTLSFVVAAWTAVEGAIVLQHLLDLEEAVFSIIRDAGAPGISTSGAGIRRHLQLTVHTE